jgi:hypothetical protein
MPVQLCRDIDLQVYWRCHVPLQTASWMHAEEHPTCVGSAALSAVATVSTLSAFRLVSSESSTCMHHCRRLFFSGNSSSGL